MSSTNPKERIFDAPFEVFAISLLPLYSGPQVTIRIGSTSCAYKVSKALLCKQSPYFAATFEGDFLEGEEQSTTLTEIEDVVSVQSFKLLLQWLHLGRVFFGTLTPKETITAAIEFVRIADMCGVTGMETLMAEHIKATIINNPPPHSTASSRAPDTNTCHLTSRHIISGMHLPEGHPVRRLLVAAAVEGYLREDNHKFLKESQECTVFAADLLKAVKDTLKSIDSHYDDSVYVYDPFSEVHVYLK